MNWMQSCDGVDPRAFPLPQDFFEVFYGLSNARGPFYLLPVWNGVNSCNRCRSTNKIEPDHLMMQDTEEVKDKYGFLLCSHSIGPP